MTPAPEHIREVAPFGWRERGRDLLQVWRELYQVKRELRLQLGEDVCNVCDFGLNLFLELFVFHTRARIAKGVGQILSYGRNPTENLSTELFTMEAS